VYLVTCIRRSQHVQMISSYFYVGGVEAAMLAGCKLSRKLMTTLQMNSLSSDQLMILYYKSLLSSSVSTVCYSGNVILTTVVSTATLKIYQCAFTVVNGHNITSAFRKVV